VPTAHNLSPRTRVVRAADVRPGHIVMESHEHPAVVVRVVRFGGIVNHLAEREPVYALVVRFAAYTGLRPGELEALRIRDINFMHRHVEVRRQVQFAPREGWSYITPKSAAGSRDAPLPGSLLLALHGHIDQHPHRGDADALLWPGRRKGGAPGQRAPLSYDVPFRHESVYKSYVMPAMVAAGVQPVVWYAFRHFYASACAAAGTAFTTWRSGWATSSSPTRLTCTCLPVPTTWTGSTRSARPHDPSRPSVGFRWGSAEPPQSTQEARSTRLPRSSGPLSVGGE